MKQTSSFQRWRRRYFKLKGRTLYYAKDTKVAVIFNRSELVLPKKEKDREKERELKGSADQMPSIWLSGRQPKQPPPTPHSLRPNPLSLYFSFGPGQSTRSIRMAGSRFVFLVVV